MDKAVKHVCTIGLAHSGVQLVASGRCRISDTFPMFGTFQMLQHDCPVVGVHSTLHVLCFHHHSLALVQPAQ